MRRPEPPPLPSPLWLMASGCLVLGVVPALSGAWTPHRAATSFIFLGLGLWGFVRSFRRGPTPFEREGDAWRVKLAGGASSTLSSFRFEPWETPAAAHGAHYAAWLEPSELVGEPLLHAEDPAWIWNEAARYLPPSAFVTSWGTGDLLQRDAAGSPIAPLRARMVGSPWSGRARIVRVLGVLLVVIAGAWLIFLGSSSALGGFSVALAVGMWLLLVWSFAVVAFDRVVVELGPELRVERRRLGRVLLSEVVPWSKLSRLESTAASRGVGHLLVVTERAFAVPLDAETRRYFTETLRLPPR